MTPNEAELIDVESHYPTDRIPMEMKEKSVAENLLDKMSETQSVFSLFHHFFLTKKFEFCADPGSIFMLDSDGCGRVAVA